MFSRTILLLLLLWTQDLVKSLRLVKLHAPSHKREGGTAHLTCQYDLEGDTLDSVKWYKDGQMFYQYMPSYNPSIHNFPLPGVKINIERSASNAVVLVDLTQESAGNYSCEVNGGVPKFDTVTRHKYLDIYLLPKSGPSVEGLKQQYNLNDLVVANCSLGASRPKSLLIWFINGRVAPASYVSGPLYRESAERPDATESILQLRFNVTEADVINGAIKLKCQAAIPSLYYQVIEFTNYIATEEKGTKHSVNSLRLVELQVPTHKREGGKALLGCQYDLQDDTLYAVRWYKDTDEFYRYVPRNEPTAYYFPVDGVKVDLRRSSSNTVALVNLTQESSGNYSCEVDGDAPRFSIAQNHKYMNIHLLPKSGPCIVGLRELYNLNDLVVANCSLALSRPKANLMWFINDRPAPSSYLSGPWYRVSAERPDAAESILQLSFVATTSDFVNGAIKLQCQATIPPLYQKEKESTHYIALPFLEAKEIKEGQEDSGSQAFMGYLSGRPSGNEKCDDEGINDEEMQV